MGRLAMERGGSPGVQNLGRELVNTHTELSDHLRDIARNEHNVVLPPMGQLTPTQRAEYDRLSMLSGPDFDRAFLSAILRLQEQTISSFNNEAVNGQDTGIREFANETIPLLNDRVRYVRTEMMRM
jgi:putative membrane protein